MNYPICYIWIQLLIPYKCLWLFFKATWKIHNLGLYVHKHECLFMWKVTDFITTRGKILPRPSGHNSDNEILSPIINSVNPQKFVLSGKKDERVAVMASRPRWAPDDSVIQSFFSRIVLKFLVCFPQSLVAFWLLSHVFWCDFPFDRLKNDWEEPILEPLLKGTTQAFFFTSLQSVTE